MGSIFAILFVLTPIILPIIFVTILIIHHERKKVKLLKEQNQLLKDLKESN